MIHEYKTARSICGFVEFAAWIGVVLAAIVLLASIATAFRGDEGIFALVAVAPSFGMLLFCFFMVIHTQMARATMDNSVTAQKSHVQAQKQHEELMRSFRQLAASPAPLSAIAPKSNPTPTADAAAERPTVVTQPARPKTSKNDDGDLEYKGVAITQESPHRYIALGKAFTTLADVEVYIDFNSNAKKLEKVATGNEPTENATQVTSEPKLVETGVSEYRGVRIEQDGYNSVVEGRRFSSLDSARAYIDELLGDDPVAVRREPTLSIPDGQS